MYIKDPIGNMFKTAVHQTKHKLTQISNAMKDSGRSTTDYFQLASEVLNRLQRQSANLKQTISGISDEQRFLFSSLIEWRILLSKVIDEKPENLVSAEKLLTLCVKIEPSVDEIKGVIGKTDKRVCEIGATKAMQAAILQNLINSQGQYIQHLRTHECHNCLKTGHGPAWACPFPKIKENYMAWYKRPENRQHLHHQFKRKRDKLVEKVGEEKADEIILSTHKKTDTGKNS